MSTRPDRIDVETANEYLVEGRALFVDARPAEKWAEAGQTIPGAIHVPPGAGAEMDEAIERLPRDRLFIVFCDEPANAASAAVARRIRELGLGDASVLDGGLRAWRAAGLPLVEPPVQPGDLDPLDDDALEALCLLTLWLGLGGGDRGREWGSSRESRERYLAGLPRRTLGDFRRFLREGPAIAVPLHHAARVAWLAPVVGERALALFGAPVRREPPSRLPSAPEVLEQILSEAESVLLCRWLTFSGAVPRASAPSAPSSELV